MKKILSGIAASSGKNQGRVKIVHNYNDTKNFQEGDILIAVMTDPTMVIMMSKAAAIVTDIGGLTCHAAIVSREMGIPCVVATKSATKNLKNGMEIFVDGDKGEIYEVSNMDR